MLIRYSFENIFHQNTFFAYTCVNNLTNTTTKPITKTKLMKPSLKADPWNPTLQSIWYHCNDMILYKKTFLQ